MAGHQIGQTGQTSAAAPPPHANMVKVKTEKSLSQSERNENCRRSRSVPQRLYNESSSDFTHSCFDDSSLTESSSDDDEEAYRRYKKRKRESKRDRSYWKVLKNERE